MPEWFETFFAGLYGEVLAATFSEADSLAQANLISRLLELRPGEAVLDIPCGMGRLALPLARMGFRVTGVDIEKRFVEHYDHAEINPEEKPRLPDTDITAKLPISAESIKMIRNGGGNEKNVQRVPN